MNTRYTKLFAMKPFSYLPRMKGLRRSFDINVTNFYPWSWRQKFRPKSRQLCQSTWWHILESWHLCS